MVVVRAIKKYLVASANRLNRAGQRPNWTNLYYILREKARVSVYWKRAGM
ncbi:MAG: hypothetical protein RL094_633 [Candidatus Parcubacteria bacterium]|jgi:hypothetical protein